jgi:hypothetical protein
MLRVGKAVPANALKAMTGNPVLLPFSSYAMVSTGVLNVFEEELFSLRLGVLYEIRLRTTAEHYDIDAQNFSKVVARFRSWRTYRCYGTNNNS